LKAGGSSGKGREKGGFGSEDRPKRKKERARPQFCKDSVESVKKDLSATAKAGGDKTHVSGKKRKKSERRFLSGGEEKRTSKKHPPIKKKALKRDRKKT